MDALPEFSQIVNKPTHKKKILDVLIINNPKHYSECEISREVGPDDPKTHKPSGHKVLVIHPITSMNLNQNRYKEK